MAVPGKLEATQTYNDDYHGWPLAPVDEPHPIRGAFIDPRPDPELGAIYHDGVDVAARDDRPERGAPASRTHRVYAIEGGKVVRATPRGERGLVDIGHFRYEHVDALVRVGQQIDPGDVIGWTCRDTWHVHIGEFDLPAGRRPDPRQPAAAGRQAAALRLTRRRPTSTRSATTRRRRRAGRGAKRTSRGCRRPGRG